MNKLTSIIHDVHKRRETFQSMLGDIEDSIMETIADHDDVLNDGAVDAIVHTSTLASKLFAFVHDMALGLPADGVTAQQHVREALVGLSELADLAFPSGEEDDEAWDRA